MKFYAKDGQVFETIGELYHGLNEMNEESFNHHVNEEKNDFSNWIKFVHADEELAENVSKTQNKEELKEQIGKKILPEKSSRVKKEIIEEDSDEAIEEESKVEIIKEPKLEKEVEKTNNGLEIFHNTIFDYDVFVKGFVLGLIVGLLFTLIFF